MERHGLRDFPWRIYFRFVLWQALILSFVFGFFVFLVGRPNGTWWFGFFIGLAFIWAFTLVIGRQFFLPLGRLIQKSRTLIRTRKSARLVDGGEDPDFPREEWDEIEATLDRFHLDLSQTSDRLLRDRDEINALMNSISDAILAITESGDVLFYNSRFERQFVSKDRSLGKLNLRDIFRAPDVLESFTSIFENRQETRIETALLTQQDVHPRDYQISVAPLRSSSDGRVYGALGIFHDVSDLKRADRIRIEFVGNASHELRTPLTSIKGYITTLQQDLIRGESASAGKFIEIINRNVDRLIQLVNDLLDLSSLESQGQLQKHRIDVRELTEFVLRNLEKEALSKGQAIFAKYSIEQLTADPRKLEQVLTNLIQNAIKYTPADARIEVQWGKDDEARPFLIVADNGPGIAGQHLSRIFERFYRVDEARSRDSGGTGLGLAIVKHIMIRHGGSVRVESAPQIGTKFICTFDQQG